MKIFIFAIFLAFTSAVPVRKSTGTNGRSLGQPYYYSYPAVYTPLGANHPSQFVSVPGEFVVEQQRMVSSVPAINAKPSSDSLGNPQKIQLLLSVPSAVPPGTSLSVTVNVNSEPSGATVVSVSNPVVSSPGDSTAPQVMTDAITVDAVNSQGSQPASPGQLPDEFDLREPILFLPPFENSKDSPVLIEMQGEAQKQQLAALLKTKSGV